MTTRELLHGYKPGALSAPVQRQAATDPATASVSPEVTASAAPFLTAEQRSKISRMQGDLTWLVHEGYVTEFIDGRLFAPPVMVEARKKEVESEEHDPENFPEAPAGESPAASPVATTTLATDAVPASEPTGPTDAVAASAGQPPAASA